jgi:hypothetical protein
MFPVELYQMFWEVLKDDLMNLFVNSNKGTLFKLNYEKFILLT